MSRYKPINYDDDLVIVYKGKEEIYRGLEDYEPMKYEPWEWDAKSRTYRLGKYKKVCLNV